VATEADEAGPFISISILGGKGKSGEKQEEEQKSTGNQGKDGSEGSRETMKEGLFRTDPSLC